jgi:hypothetical protein
MEAAMAEKKIEEIKCPECGEMHPEGECPLSEKEEDGCGKKKKKDSGVPHVSRCDVYDDDWNFTFQETPEGYLMGKAVVTNIGVFTYLNADGTYSRELRPTEEVHKPDSMWTLRGKPITNDHPDERVTVDNIGKYSVGKTEGDPIFDPYHLSIGLVFDNKDAIIAIKNGKRALSCGYDCDLEPKSGVWMGVPYDSIQRNIVYNHISLVDRGRAGDAAIIRMDSADATFIHIKEKEVPMADKALRTITIDSVDFQAEDKVIEVYQAEKARSDKLQIDLDGLNAEKSTIVAERDALKEKQDALQKQFDEMKANHIDKSEIEKLVKARMDLYDVARKAKVEFKDTDSEKDIMVAVIKAVAPKAKLDDADDVYIQTRYKIVVEDMEVKQDTDADSKSRELNAPDKRDDKDVSVEANRQAMMDRMLKGVGK